MSKIRRRQIIPAKILNLTNIHFLLSENFFSHCVQSDHFNEVCRSLMVKMGHFYKAYGYERYIINGYSQERKSQHI